MVQVSLNRFFNTVAAWAWPFLPQAQSGTTRRATPTGGLARRATPTGGLESAPSGGSNAPFHYKNTHFWNAHRLKSGDGYRDGSSTGDVFFLPVLDNPSSSPDAWPRFFVSSQQKDPIWVMLGCKPEQCHALEQTYTTACGANFSKGLNATTAAFSSMGYVWDVWYGVENATVAHTLGQHFTECIQTHSNAAWAIPPTWIGTAVGVGLMLGGLGIALGYGRYLCPKRRADPDLASAA